MPPVDTGQLAYSAFGLYSFSLINWLAGILPDDASARAQLRAGLDLLFTGLAPKSLEGAAPSAPSPSATARRRRSGALREIRQEER